MCRCVHTVHASHPPPRSFFSPTWDPPPEVRRGGGSSPATKRPAAGLAFSQLQSSPLPCQPPVEEQILKGFDDGGGRRSSLLRLKIPPPGEVHNSAPGRHFTGPPFWHVTCKGRSDRPGCHLAVHCAWGREAPTTLWGAAPSVLAKLPSKEIPTPPHVGCLRLVCLHLAPSWKLLPRNLCHRRWPLPKPLAPLLFA